MAVQKISDRAASGGLTGAELVPLVRVGGDPDVDIQDTAQAIANISPNVTSGELYSMRLDDANRFNVVDDGGNLSIELRAADAQVFAVNPTGAISASGGATISGTITGRVAITHLPSSGDVAELPKTWITDQGSGGTIELQVPDSSLGTQFTFVVLDNAIQLSGNTYTQQFYFWDSDTMSTHTTPSFLLSTPGMSATITKLYETVWAVTANNGGVDND